MTFRQSFRIALSLLVFLSTVFAVRAQTADAAAMPDAEVTSSLMQLTSEGGKGISGLLKVAAGVATGDSADDLVYTIKTEPMHGKVGLAGGDYEDVFQNKTARIGYFAYRPDEDYEGTDSFAYEVLNRATGRTYSNEVSITVTPPPPVELDAYSVTAERDRSLQAVPVTLNTRPNLPVAARLPSHEDFMTEANRMTLANTKVVYRLDERAAPAHGEARLDQVTGQLSYTPAAGFIGEDRFKYYTVDENHPALGVENEVVISVEPIRTPRTKVADRSTRREVDLLFVINNSPSMAPHQQRIAENLKRFRQLFDERQLDYRIGVLTTDFVNKGQRPYKRVRGVELDAKGQPVPGRDGKPKLTTKQVASNGSLVTLPVMPRPWITPQTPDSVFAELVRVGTNGDSNRTAFTAVYNFVADAYNKQNDMLRPEATTIVVFFMDEEETRMATWRTQPDGTRKAEWLEDGKLPQLLQAYNEKYPDDRQTLDGYINYWVLRPFIILKGNQRGKIEMNAVVSPDNVSHRRAAELTGGSVLNIEGDFSADLAALGDRIAETVAVALDPLEAGATLYQPSLRVLVDGQPVAMDPKNGYIYDGLTHSIRFQGYARRKAFAARIEITYEEHR